MPCRTGPGENCKGQLTGQKNGFPDEVVRLPEIELPTISTESRVRVDKRHHRHRSSLQHIRLSLLLFLPLSRRRTRRFPDLLLLHWVALSHHPAQLAISLSTIAFPTEPPSVTATARQKKLVLLGCTCGT